MDVDHHYVLQGHYGGEAGWEDLTAADTREEIEDYLKEYQENEGGRYRIVPCQGNWIGKSPTA